ncbi:DNA-processing protein DprA [Rhizohabitans arisaemae]|uniref:DNA-processing protein DprA n=1 Tax=Rhizohabitans arisaemae TaxID=2720610 RepID=UPI0024B105D3|nr:DNA-processing protein DprA [Rhizohabitans arisaemae]
MTSRKTGAAPPGGADRERLARVTLSRVAEAADPVMGRLVHAYGAEAAVDRIRRGSLPAKFVESERSRARAERRRFDPGGRLQTWIARLDGTDPRRDLAQSAAHGARVIVPGDPEWPSQVDDLGDRRPLALWARGETDLRFSCLKSVSVVGSRSATPYGVHVAGEIAADLSRGGWGVISGGAYGIDGAAHRGALTGETPSVGVLACGVDVTYPRGHTELFRALRRTGLLVSESPPGVSPTRIRFLVRNRLIAALSRGTVVVEAALRSGALNTAAHAVTLSRHLAVVPGPVTSGNSAGCHRLLRSGAAVCVTGAAEVIELVGELGADLAPVARGPVLARDALDERTRRVLDAVPSRGRAETASIAVAAGVDIGTVLQCLGELAAGGYVVRAAGGWRLKAHDRT